MEVYTSFLLLMLTWTAPQTFCKSLNTDGKPGNTDADGQMIADQVGDMVLKENQIPSGMRETAPVGQDIEVVNGEPLKTWDGGEDESGNISGKEQVVFLYDDKTGGKEVEMSFGDSSPEERMDKGMVLVGDMWLNQDQLPSEIALGEEAEIIQGQSSPGVKEESRKWPNGILYYELDRHLPAWAKNDIKQAVRSLQNRLDSCIRFEESSRDDAVYVYGGHYCFSRVGYQGRGKYRNQIQLASGCLTSNTGGREGSIQHEFLHALGVFHTQSRWDRDNYVTIHKENIKEHAWFNFKTELGIKTSTYGLPYDYSSVMHYGGRAFSKDRARLLTIETKNPRHQRLLGQRDRLSDLDVKLVKRMYRCS